MQTALSILGLVPFHAALRYNGLTPEGVYVVQLKQVINELFNYVKHIKISGWGTEF